VNRCYFTKHFSIGVPKFLNAVKGNGKVFPFHAMQDHRDAAALVLNLATTRSKWLTSRASRFTPENNSGVL
jgi:hypothetical protein